MTQILELLCTCAGGNQACSSTILMVYMITDEKLPVVWRSDCHDRPINMSEIDVTQFQEF